jgi:hypothetical protein
MAVQGLAVFPEAGRTVWPAASAVARPSVLDYHPSRPTSARGSRAVNRETSRWKEMSLREEC